MVLGRSLMATATPTACRRSAEGGNVGLCTAWLLAQKLQRWHGWSGEHDCVLLDYGFVDRSPDRDAVRPILLLRRSASRPDDRHREPSIHQSLLDIPEAKAHGPKALGRINDTLDTTARDAGGSTRYRHGRGHDSPAYPAWPTSRLRLAAGCDTDYGNGIASPRSTTGTIHRVFGNMAAQHPRINTASDSGVWQPGQLLERLPSGPITRLRLGTDLDTRAEQTVFRVQPFAFVGT